MKLLYLNFKLFVAREVCRFGEVLISVFARNFLKSGTGLLILCFRAMGSGFGIIKVF